MNTTRDNVFLTAFTLFIATITVSSVMIARDPQDLRVEPVVAVADRTSEDALVAVKPAYRVEEPSDDDVETIKNKVSIVVGEPIPHTALVKQQESLRVLTFSEEQFIALLDRIAPIKKTKVDPLWWRALKLPYTALSYVPASIQVAVVLYLFAKYRPDLLVWGTKETAKIVAKGTVEGVSAVATGTVDAAANIVAATAKDVLPETVVQGSGQAVNSVIQASAGWAENSEMLEWVAKKLGY